MRKLKWAVYYAVVLLTVGIAAVVFRNRLVFGWSSVVPVLFAASVVGVKYGWPHTYEGRNFEKIRAINNPLPVPVCYDEVDRKYEVLENFLLLAFLPLYSPMIFFFSFPVKLGICAGLTAVFGLIVILYGIPVVRKAQREAMEQSRRDLKEQQRKEELGKWK